MPFWQSNGNGTWAKGTVTIPAAQADANPIYAEDDWGYLPLWTEGGTDHIWYDLGRGSSYLKPSGNTSLPAGSRPIPRPFVNADTDIFWYRPGSATDRLFHF